MFQIKIIKDKHLECPKVQKRTAVRAIIYHKNQLLMVETNQGDYKFPGGGVEKKEGFREALLREIAEETGYCDVEIGPCVGTAFEQNEDTNEPGTLFQMESYYYICRLLDGQCTDLILDDYEEKLGFHAKFVDVETALLANKALMENNQQSVIPWLERETKVLTKLTESFVEKIVLEVYECGKIILNADRSKADIDEKAGHANFVTVYDKLVQRELESRLSGIIPEAAFVGEEEDIHASIERGYAFIVDPIDGTTNFINDYHCSCISVGVTRDGERIAGIVYNPYLNEVFTAEKGKGAWKNGSPIHVSGKALEQGVVLFGTAPYYDNLKRKSFQMAYDYFTKSLDVRRSGSAAFDLCNIACGRAELYFEMLLSPWDFAAGSLIVEEAGGMVSTIDKKPLTLNKPCSLIATNGIDE